jgi:hypothetical protein
MDPKNIQSKENFLCLPMTCLEISPAKQKIVVGAVFEDYDPRYERAVRSVITEK